MTVTTTKGPTTRGSGTGTRASAVLGGLALIGLAWLVVFGFLLSPADEVQGDSVRLMYVHVPSAWLAYLSFGVTAFCSAAYLWRRTRSLAWDRIAGCSAEIGLLFTGLALVTGMTWGQVTWGHAWDWGDARLVTTALLFLLFVGYVALRRLPASPEVRAKRAAVGGLIAFLDVPLVHQSVEWFRTLHQKPTILRRDLNPQIDGIMLFSVFVGVVAFTLVYLWLMMHRNRVAMMEAAMEAKGLEVALAERRGDAVGPAAPAVAR
jgi:heme exporter protein C